MITASRGGFGQNAHTSTPTVLRWMTHYYVHIFAQGDKKSHQPIAGEVRKTAIQQGRNLRPIEAGPSRHRFVMPMSSLFTVNLLGSPSALRLSVSGD